LARPYRPRHNAGRSRRTVLEHESIEMSSIETMYRSPAFEPVADAGGNTLFTGDADQSWYKAMIPVSVN